MALIIAIARPVSGVEADIIETQGVAVMVVLDVSASMDAQDIKPSRLERAKLDLRDLFQALAGNELGIVLFAGDAFVQCPLTNDVDSAITFLNAANSSSITRQGSSIETALRLAIDSFDERIAAHSIIILVSDGENQEGDPLLAAQDAADRGIIIHAVGYGGFDGVPIPFTNADGLTEYKADRSGKVVLTRLYEDLLVQIAGSTGGLYRQVSGGGEEIKSLAGRINAIEGEVLESRLSNRPVERFGIFVFLALLALTVEILLPEARIEVV